MSAPPSDYKPWELNVDVGIHDIEFDDKRDRSVSKPVRVPPRIPVEQIPELQMGGDVAPPFKRRRDRQG